MTNEKIAATIREIVAGPYITFQVQEATACASVVAQMREFLNRRQKPGDIASYYLVAGRDAYNDLVVDPDVIRDMVFLKKSLDTAGLMGIYFDMRVLSDALWSDFDAVVPTGNLYLIRRVNGVTTGSVMVNPHSSMDWLKWLLEKPTPTSSQQ